MIKKSEIIIQNIRLEEKIEQLESTIDYLRDCKNSLEEENKKLQQSKIETNTIFMEFLFIYAIIVGFTIILHISLPVYNFLFL